MLQSKTHKLQINEQMCVWVLLPGSDLISFKMLQSSDKKLDWSYQGIGMIRKSRIIAM